MTTLPGGLLSATGLDVSPNGDIYVAELFAGRISRIPAGESAAETWRSTPLPGDVTYQGRQAVGHPERADGSLR